MLDKLKSLFSKDQAEEQAWKERGAGRKLGTAEPGQLVKPRPSAPLNATAQPAPSSQGQAGGSAQQQPSLAPPPQPLGGLKQHWLLLDLGFGA